MTTTIVSPNPLPSDIDWAQVATVLDIKIVQRRTLSDVLADADVADSLAEGDESPTQVVELLAEVRHLLRDVLEKVEVIASHQDHRGGEVCESGLFGSGEKIGSAGAGGLDAINQAVHSGLHSLVCENSKGTARDGAASRTAPYSTSEASRLIDIASAELKRVLRDTGRGVIR